ARVEHIWCWTCGRVTGHQLTFRWGRQELPMPGLRKYRSGVIVAIAKSEPRSRPSTGRLSASLGANNARKN
ncbi:MAG TPA: hypothetical protein VFV92_01670, partial [Candidatus Bathyarchaeia archaeon]|nr:hypothetical protein [Candidatus Bathyarchaeia archaeon]